MHTQKPIDEGIVREGKEAINEGNKLIAEFMGEKLWGATGKEMAYYIENIPDYWSKAWLFENLQYHSSWDWLMPVVEKIESTQVEGKYFNYYGFGVTVVQDYCSIKCYERNKQDGHIYMTPYGFKPASKINAVWLAIIEFIKWYNLNHTPNEH